jgi:sugar phosphate isomerase/epimerase
MAPASPPLLFSTGAFFGRPLDEGLRRAAEAGYASIEVMVTKDPDSQDPARIASLAAAYGLSIGAVHAPCLVVTRRVWGRDPVGKVLRAVEMARRLGVPVVITHSPYRWQRGYHRWLLEDLPNIEERSGTTVAVENMFPLRMGSKVALRFHAEDQIRGPEGRAHLTLDTSHAAVAGDDPRESARRAGSRLRHIHLSDNAGKGWDSHLPPGRGILDLDGLLRDLVAGDYRGAITLEVDLRRQREQDPAGTHALMVQMREWVESRLNEDPTHG